MLKLANARQNNKTNPLRASTRSTFLLKEFGRSGETLELPITCELEFPDAPLSGEISANKYKRFIIHFTPDDGLYEGGVFRIEIEATPEYPFKPPKAKMLTKLWHPNVDLQGAICHNYLKVDPAFGEGAGYSPALGMSGVVTGLLNLFYGGENPDDPLNLEAAQQYKTNRSAFDSKAKQWTNEHAKPIKIPNHCQAHAIPE